MCGCRAVGKLHAPAISGCRTVGSATAIAGANPEAAGSMAADIHRHILRRGRTIATIAQRRKRGFRKHRGWCNAKRRVASRNGMLEAGVKTVRVRNAM